MKLAYLAHIAKCVEGDVVEHFMDKSEDSNSDKDQCSGDGIEADSWPFCLLLNCFFAFSGAKRQGMS